jgi:hypothetical protein
MTDGLIELIFLQVPDSKVDSLVSEIVQNANPFELFHSELGNLDPKKSELGIISLLQQFAEPSSVFIRSDILNVGEVWLDNPLIRIVRYDELNEVAVVFDAVKIVPTSWESFVDKLAIGAKKLAVQSEAYGYCCGLEPGTDEETQFFSSERIGPPFSL